MAINQFMGTVKDSALALSFSLQLKKEIDTKTFKSKKDANSKVFEQINW